MDRKYSNISRIEGSSSKGWFVRVSFDGKKRSRFFADRKHGGKRKALALAREQREAFRQELGKPDTKRRILMRNAQNQSGVRGVTRKKISSKAGDYAVYEVTWQSAPRKTNRKRFSVTQHGEKKARDLAVGFRKKMELKLYGILLD